MALKTRQDILAEGPLEQAHCKDKRVLMSDTGLNNKSLPSCCSKACSAARPPMLPSCCRHTQRGTIAQALAKPRAKSSNKRLAAVASWLTT